MYIDQHYFLPWQNNFPFFEWDFLSTVSVYILKIEQYKWREFSFLTSKCKKLVVLFEIYCSSARNLAHLKQLCFSWLDYWFEYIFSNALGTKKFTKALYAGVHIILLMESWMAFIRTLQLCQQIMTITFWSDVWQFIFGDGFVGKN